LKKLPSRHLTLWRGVTVNIEKNYKEGEELTWWSFSTCSSSLNVIQNFIGHASTLFLIDGENGKDISAYSNFPDEKEVLINYQQLHEVSSFLLYDYVISNWPLLTNILCRYIDT
jgi:hypothetical protein